ncbi:hypothetical protein ROHU_005673 [Labeo rohita]|uniref:Uncharacterized protein n=1 Tax=Labeo rohita TaxID=84645 RepID=A0A498NCG0_LABRO|nr:hypothetical protein ROHU_005673 [Labeo rohita]
MENLPKLSSSQALRLLVSDPQVEPARMKHRKRSLGDADIHRPKAARPSGAQHKTTPTLTGPTRGASLLQVAQQDRGELLLSQRSHVVKDAAQSPNATVQRSKHMVRTMPH